MLFPGKRTCGRGRGFIEFKYVGKGQRLVKLVTPPQLQRGELIVLGEVFEPPPETSPPPAMEVSSAGEEYRDYAKVMLHTYLSYLGFLYIINSIYYCLELTKLHAFFFLLKHCKFWNLPNTKIFATFSEPNATVTKKVRFNQAHSSPFVGSTSQVIDYFQNSEKFPRAAARTFQRAMHCCWLTRSLFWYRSFCRR